MMDASRPEEQTELFQRATMAHSIAHEARGAAWDAKRAAYTAMALAGLAGLIALAALIVR